MNSIFLFLSKLLSIEATESSPVSRYNEAVEILDEKQYNAHKKDLLIALMALATFFNTLVENSDASERNKYFI